MENLLKMVKHIKIDYTKSSHQGVWLSHVTQVVMSHDHLSHDQRKFNDHSDNLSLTARNEYLSRVSFLANHRSYIEKKPSFAVNEIYKKIYGANLALKI